MAEKIGTAQIEITADSSGVETSLAKAKKSLADLGSTATKSGKDAAAGMGQVSGASEKMDAATKRAARSIELQALALGKSKSEYQAAKAAIDGNAAALAPYIAKLKEAEIRAGSAAKAQSGFAGGLGNLKGALAGLGLGISIGGMAAFVKHAIDAADETGKLAQKTGLASEQVAGLQLAFRQAGAGDEFQKSLSKLAKNAADGSKAFEAMGITVKGSDGNLKSTRQLIGEVADKFKGYSDSAEKTALAQELFGKSGANLIPLLNAGGKALDDYDQMAQKLGLTLSDEATKNAEKFNDTIDLVGQGVTGVGRQIAVELLPTLTSMAGELFDTATSGDTLKNVAGALASSLKALYSVGVGVIQVFKTVGTAVGGVGAAIAAVVSGDFAQAKNVIANLSTDIKASWASAGESIGKVWEGAGNKTVDAMAATAAALKKAGDASKNAAPRVSEFGDSVQKSAKATKAANDDFSKLVNKIKEQTDGYAKAEAATNGYNKSQEEFLELASSDAWGKLTNDQRAYVAALYETKITQEQAADAAKNLVKANLDAANAREKYITSLGSGVEKLQAEIEAQKESNERLGLSKEAIEELDRAKLELMATELERQAIRENDKNLDSQEFNLLKQQAQGYRDLAKLKKDGAGKEASLELGKASEEAAKKAADDWAKTAESINGSITDALMRGFESGKDAAKNLRDTVINMFKTLVLRPTINGAVNMAAGAIGLGDVAGAGGGGSSILGMANNASTAYSAYSAVAGGISSLGGSISALGTKFGITAAAEFGAGMQGASLAAGLAGPVTTGGGAMGAGAAAAGALKSVAAVIPYAAVALIVANALGVFRSKKIVGSGIMGELGGESLQSYDLQRKGGTLFSGPSYSIQNVKDNAEFNYVQDAYKQLRTATSSMADTLGVGSDAIKSFTTKIGTEVIHQEVGKTGIKFDGLKPEEIAKKIEEALLSANEEMAKFVLGATDFGKKGETASQTLQRLAGSLTTVNTIFGNLGFELKEASLAGGDAASDFADLFGGMDKLVAATSSYYDNFYSEAERTANSTKQLSEELQKLGVDGLPATRDGFRKLVDEAFGSGNDELGASLINLSKDFADLTQETNNLGEAAAAAAEKVANEAKGLNTRLLQAQGDVGALRQQEIDALDESNQALLKHIFAIEDKAKADAEAAAIAQQIAGETASLNTRLMQAEGDLAGLRREEINAVDESNRALLSQILALEKYNQIAAESDSLVGRLLQTQGDTVALRERELSTLHESNQVLLKHIYMLEDQAKATELLGKLSADFAQYGLSELEKKISAIDDVAESSIDSLEKWGQASYDNILLVERWADASRKAAIAAEALQKAQSNFDDLGKAVEIERQALANAFEQVRSALQAEIDKFVSDLSNVKGLFARSAAAEKTSLTDAANSQKSALQKQIDAMNGVSDASKKAADNLNSVIDALEGAINNLRDIDVLKKTNYADAVSQIDKMIAQAGQGIFPDSKDLQQPLSVITSNTADSYASSFDFNRDQLVQASKLEELANLAGKELGFEDKVIEADEKQLQALQDQIQLIDDQLQADLKALDEITKWGEAQFNALEGIDASIVTMDEAQKAVAELTSKYQDDQVKKIEAQMKQAEDEHKKSMLSLNMIYQAGLMQLNALQGINATLGSANYHLGILSQSVQAADQAKKQADEAAKDVPGFAAGGYHKGGLRIVGEDGPELELTGPAKYWDASTTRSILQGSPDPSGEVRSLREDSRSQANAIVSLLARFTKQIDRWDRDGMPAVRTEDA